MLTLRNTAGLPHYRHTARKWNLFYATRPLRFACLVLASLVPAVDFACSKLELLNLENTWKGPSVAAQQSGTRECVFNTLACKLR